MKYLFFDIEGANCYNFVSKMCTFGYVITTDKFDIISKIDVVMNPESSFDKHIIESNMNAYDLKKYRQSPSFPYFYKSIKNILENNEQLIVGWSIENDVRYIYDACNRYKLPQIKYKYLDLQKVVMLFDNTNVLSNLESTCDNYKIDYDTTLHKSDDDAFLTMKIAEYICKQKKINLEKLFELYPSCISSVSEYANTKALSDEEIQEKINRKKINRIISSTKPKNKYINDFIKEGDIFAFEQNVVSKKADTLPKIIHYIKDCGADCTTSINKCNKLIYINTINKRPKHNEHDEEIILISYNELLKMIKQKVPV